MIVNDMVWLANTMVVNIRSIPIFLFQSVIIFFGMAGFTPSSYADTVGIVNNLAARYYQGQIFLTYKLKDTANVQYRVYQSSNPILLESDLDNANNLGYVLDDTGCNERYANTAAGKFKKLGICGEVEAIRFKIPKPSGSSTEEVKKGYGLFVVTLKSSKANYYAVTTQVHGENENRTILAGENSLLLPIAGDAVKPMPVYQNNISVNPQFDAYVLYVTSTSNPYFPKMTTAGSYGYNFALGQQTTYGNPKTLYFNMHGGGGSFLDNSSLPDDPDVVVINQDDYVPFNSGNIKKGSSTLWFGFHEKFDIYFGLYPKPTTGKIMNYTLARTGYMIDWALENSALYIDPNKVYIKGTSAGGDGAWQAALVYPDKIAAIRSSKSIWVFNKGATGDDDKNQKFGAVSSNLPTNLNLNGYKDVPYYDFVDASYVLGTIYKGYDVPVLIAVNGKNDKTVGWSNMIELYDSLETSNHGGFFYFDGRSHGDQSDKAQWTDDQVCGQTDDQWNGETLSSYRLDLPYAAFSHVSCDSNPGNGNPNNGDDYGTIHGFVDWIPESVMQSGKNFSMQLLARSRTIDSGVEQKTLNPPGGVPCTVNVTIKRLPSKPKMGKTYEWFYTDSKGTQSGQTIYDGIDLTFKDIKLRKDIGILEFSLDGI